MPPLQVHIVARQSVHSTGTLLVSSISIPEIEMEHMCDFWNFGKRPSWLSSRALRPMGLLFNFKLGYEPTFFICFQCLLY